MESAKNGDKVKVEFTGTLPDGTVFGRATEEDPLEFTLGNQEIIPGFEEAIVGMAPGESKTANIPAEKGFGKHDDRKCIELRREQFPDGLEPQVGKKIGVKQADGTTIKGTVEEVGDANVKVNFNHPLAGQDLNVEIKLIEIT